MLVPGCCQAGPGADGGTSGCSAANKRSRWFIVMDGVVAGVARRPGWSTMPMPLTRLNRSSRGGQS